MEKLKRNCSYISSVLILVMALLLIISCIRIYQSGSRPFTREVIGEAAGRLALPGILCLLAVIIGLCLPQNAQKTIAIRKQKALLFRYQADLSAARKEQIRRKRWTWFIRFADVLLFAYPAIYMLDPENFQVTDVNGDVLRAAYVVLVPTLVVMALGLLLGHLNEKSISREIEIYKANNIKPGKAPAKKNGDQKQIAILRAVVFATGVILVIIGACNGGAADVLGKAIRICTECIGLG